MAGLLIKTNMKDLAKVRARENRQSAFITNTYKIMLLAGWEVRIGKKCDRGFENAARGRRPREAFSSPRSKFFPIRTDPKPANNIFIFYFLAVNCLTSGFVFATFPLNRLTNHSQKV